MKSSEEREFAAATFEKRRRKRRVQKSNAGRPASLDQQKLDSLLQAYYSHPYSFRELAGMFGVSRMTVWRAVQDAAPGFGRAIA